MLKWLGIFPGVVMYATTGNPYCVLCYWECHSWEWFSENYCTKNCTVLKTNVCYASPSMSYYDPLYSWKCCWRAPLMMPSATFMGHAADYTWDHMDYSDLSGITHMMNTGFYQGTSCFEWQNQHQWRRCCLGRDTLCSAYGSRTPEANQWSSSLRHSIRHFQNNRSFPRNGLLRYIKNACWTFGICFLNMWHWGNRSYTPLPLKNISLTHCVSTQTSLRGHWLCHGGTWWWRWLFW